jgi:lipoprotein-releasing system permease protein
MFQLLLAIRYLRTRYIALASIISVMLGVATMIVVNSVMAGFREEMYDRLHGILSDIVIESHSMEGIEETDTVVAQLRAELGDDLQGLTTAIHIPAMLNFPYGGTWVTRHVNLIGIDDQTYASVSDFSKFLLHPENQRQLSFGLRANGYDPRIGEAGWEHRQLRVASERLYERHRQEIRQSQAGNVLEPTPGSGSLAAASIPDGETTADSHASTAVDPFLAAADEGHVFDEMTEQYPGIVLGISISCLRQREADGSVRDYYLCRPGDDVKLTFPSAGTPPQAVHSSFTVVDFYESKMSEYDSTFAFCPLSKLQELRGMINPETGRAAVTSIQLKLRKEADLNQVRDKLRALFPLEIYRYRIETWKDMQGPLLAAVQWETTILNILLFMIIAVAGFGIFATFFMIVIEKTRDIGILKSLGAPSRGVMAIFVSYGFTLGVVGSSVGMVLGVVFVWNINKIADWLEWLTGQEVFDPTVYYFDRIPTILNPFTIGWIVIGAMFIAVLASILPAFRAARMHPVEALRYE